MDNPTGNIPEIKARVGGAGRRNEKSMARKVRVVARIALVVISIGAALFARYTAHFFSAT